MSNNEIMTTKYDNALLCWDHLLDTQTEILLPFELQYYYSCEPFLASKNVLEVGCGNGYYLAALHKFFSDKEFVGIDISKELVELAIDNHQKEGIQFIEADFFTYKPLKTYDAVLMRLTVQHMKKFEEIFSHASTLLKSSGSLIIIEPEPSLFRNIPATPLFQKLLEEVRSSSEKLKKNRAMISDFDTTLRNINGWELDEIDLYVVPQVGQFNNSKLMQMFLLWIDIFENAKAFNFNFKEVRDELAQWAEQEAAYSQIAMKIYSLSKRN